MKRGSSGRILAGRSAGGLSYGYRVVRELDARGEPVRGLRAVDPGEAAVIRRIFADYAAGASPRAIAGALQPASWYQRAQRFRRVYRDRVNALFQKWDVVLAPATPVSAPLLGSEWLDINGQQHPCRPSLGLLTQPISFAGCPVVAAPFWPQRTHGMPIGVQVIAAPWREDLALRVAMTLQRSGLAHGKKAAL